MITLFLVLFARAVRAVKERKISSGVMVVNDSHPHHPSLALSPRLLRCLENVVPFARSAAVCGAQDLWQNWWWMRPLKLNIYFERWKAPIEAAAISAGEIKFHLQPLWERVAERHGGWTGEEGACLQ